MSTNFENGERVENGKCKGKAVEVLAKAIASLYEKQILADEDLLARLLEWTNDESLELLTDFFGLLDGKGVQ